MKECLIRRDGNRQDGGRRMPSGVAQKWLILLKMREKMPRYALQCGSRRALDAGTCGIQVASCLGGYRRKDSAPRLQGHGRENRVSSATLSRQQQGYRLAVGQRVSHRHPRGGTQRSRQQLVTRRRWGVAFTRPQSLPHIRPGTPFGDFDEIERGEILRA
jgi:hypothetical protein